MRASLSEDPFAKLKRRTRYHKSSKLKSHDLAIDHIYALEDLADKVTFLFT
jgi:hypothetical protein